MIRRRILLGVALAALFGVGWAAGRVRATGTLYRNVDVFLEVLHAVQTSYVDPVESRPLIVGGVRGLLRSLDPYSRYLEPQEMDAFRAELEDENEGVGALVDMHEGFPEIVTPLEGSPAWEAGLQPGDVILKVDGHSTQNLSVPEVAARLRGAAGTKVTLTIVREGDRDDRDVTIERRKLDTRGVPYAFVPEPGIGYLRLARFTGGAAGEVAAAIDSLRAAGARALVLDLRDDPGGLVEQAVAVTQQFVPEGTLVASTKGRVTANDRIWRAGRSRHEIAWPMAVLVDEGTASAAEIVAGALQDVDRALVVGRATYGKGAVQELFPLRNRSGAIELTTAWYTTPSGRSLQRPHGLPPEDDGGDEDAPADSAKADTAAGAVYRTAAGRVVHAGGGIAPDVVVGADSLGPLALEVAERRLDFRFAGQWVPAHGTALDAAAWDAYRDFLAAQGARDAAERFAAEKDALAPGLRREFARRSAGAAAAARVSLGDDAAFRRAVAALRAAKAPRDVFAAATGGGPAPKRRPGLRREPQTVPAPTPATLPERRR